MKKLISVIAVLVMTAAVFSGCSDFSDTTTDTTASEVPSEASKTETPDSADNGFDGFVEYMSEGGFIKGSGVELTASAIGASKGMRYTITSGSAKIYVELYEFEDQTSKLASKTISEARTRGTFSLYDSTETATRNTAAAVTDDGRFLMLYTDSSTNANNIDTKNKAIEAVKNFGK